VNVKIRLTVLKNGAPGNWGGSILEPGRMLMATPRYITPDPATTYKAGPQFGVSGVNDDLLVRPPPCIVSRSFNEFDSLAG
jgi:hypothetical protein